MQLNSEETAAVLAGLRMLQQALITGNLPPFAHEILMGSDGPGLSPEDIDEFCERINTETKPCDHFQSDGRGACRNCGHFHGARDEG